MALLPELERGPTWSDEWRAECEARMVADFPRYQRLAYYEAIARRRGEAAARSLSEDVRKVYATRGG